MTEALTWMSTDAGKWLMTGLALLAIGILAWIIECFMDKRRKR